MRRRAEAEHARRKQAREANQSQRSLEIEIEGDDAQTRFFERQLLFRLRFGRMGALLLALTWLLHNCLAHPLLGLCPCRATLWLHDRSADWVNLSPVPSRSQAPSIPSRRAWLVHNCIAHPLMGLAPFARPFTLHDTSAVQMRVRGWI